MDHIQVNLKRVVNRLLQDSKDSRITMPHVVEMAFDENWTIGETQSIIKMLYFFGVRCTLDLKTEMDYLPKVFSIFSFDYAFRPSNPEIPTALCLHPGKGHACLNPDTLVREAATSHRNPNYG